MSNTHDLENTKYISRRRFFKSSLALASIGTLYGSLGMLSKAALAQAHAPAHTSSTCLTPNLLPYPVPEHIQLPTGQPLGTLPLLKNTSKQKGVFKAKLTAAEVNVPLVKGNKPTAMWLYNATLLPTIEAQIGDEVEITFHNKLPQDGTVHWHGLPVPSSQDGNPQDPVAPNASHTYQFKLTDDMAGTHWFHPHTHGRVAEQVYRGLAGVFIVKDPNDPLRLLPEQRLFFSDLRLDAQAQIPPNNFVDEVNGREGQFALVNGQLRPKTKVQDITRWRMWNGNSARYLNLQFPTAYVTAYLVGNDHGLLEAPVKITELLITPGERAEVVLIAKQNGAFDLIAKAYERGKMGQVPAEQDLVLATVETEMPIGKRVQLPQKLRTITDYAQYDAYIKGDVKDGENGEGGTGQAPRVQRTITFTQGECFTDFYIDGKQYDMDRIDITMKVGEVEEWTIYNRAPHDHNFHMHGTHFLVKEFEEAGNITKPSYKMIKDTINLKPYEKARILTMQNQKGLRMYHCHILEHENVGMMAQLMAK